MYKIFDLPIDSEILLPELPIVESDNPIMRFSVSSASTIDGSRPEWFHRWYVDDEKTEVGIAVARIGADILLRFPKRADFRISKNCDRIEGFPAEGILPGTLRHLLLDQVIPRVVGQRGKLVLHASAVEMPDGNGVAFLGASGRGKSTLASSFYRNGARLVTDDCLLIDEIGGRLVGIPAYSGSRLWMDSADVIFPCHDNFQTVSELSDKKRLILHERAEFSGAVGLNAVFLLGDPAESGQAKAISIDRIEGAEAIMAMIRGAFMLDVKDMNAAARQFSSAGRIATTSPVVYALKYPHDFGRLDEVRDAVASTLAA